MQDNIGTTNRIRVLCYDVLECKIHTSLSLLSYLLSGAPEAVWQVWRPPYQSKVKRRTCLSFLTSHGQKHLLFYMFLSHEF